MRGECTIFFLLDLCVAESATSGCVNVDAHSGTSMMK